MMKCPYCGNEMERGVIQSPHEISWTDKKHFFGRAGFHKGSVVLSQLSFLTGSAVRAYCCKSCKKVSIDYSDPESALNAR